MASGDEDGGPAFPNAERPLKFATQGMTLRDWFAGKALAGLLASADDWNDETAASVSYDYADAMLEARK